MLPDRQFLRVYTSLGTNLYTTMSGRENQVLVISIDIMEHTKSQAIIYTSTNFEIRHNLIGGEDDSLVNVYTQSISHQLDSGAQTLESNLGAFKTILVVRNRQLFALAQHLEAFCWRPPNLQPRPITYRLTVPIMGKLCPTSNAGKTLKMPQPILPITNFPCNIQPHDFSVP